MKLFSDAKRFILSARILEKDGYREFMKYDFNGMISEAAKFMTDAVIRQLGDGDNENGGRGSLRNCYGDIFNCFLSDGHYEYADCEFSILPVYSALDFMK